MVVLNLKEGEWNLLIRLDYCILNKKTIPKIVHNKNMSLRYAWNPKSLRVETMSINRNKIV